MHDAVQTSPHDQHLRRGLQFLERAREGIENKLGVNDSNDKGVLCAHPTPPPPPPPTAPAVPRIRAFFSPTNASDA